MAFLFDPRFVSSSGAKLYFYRGSTTTALTTYQDAEVTTPHANPVVADANGIFPAIFLSTVNDYKFILKDADDVTLATVDDIPVGSQIDAGSLSAAVDAAEAAQAAAEAAVAASNQRFLPVRVVDTGEVDPATGYEAGDVIDGITLVAGDYILRATSGGDPSDGVYVTTASGAATRLTNFTAFDDYPGSFFSVQEGGVNAETIWSCTSDVGGTIDTNDLVLVSGITTAKLADNSVTNAKLTATHSLALSHTVANRTALKALDTSRYNVVYLQDNWRDAPFGWDGSDLSSVLLGSAINSSAVDSGTEEITSVGHGLVTGNAAITTTAVNGLALNTIYYVIRVDDDTYQLATTFAHAMAGTAFNLTGTSSVTIQRHLDPEEGIYVTPTSDVSGASGAWVYPIKEDVNSMWFGAIQVTDSSAAHTANQAAFMGSTAIADKVYWPKSTYEFGSITGDEALFTLTSKKEIDWQGSHIKTDGDGNGGAFTATSFIRAQDTPFCMYNYEFTDSSFAHGNSSRGCNPIEIRNTTVETSGYTFGPMIVHKGQSLLTAFEPTPLATDALASDINFVGHCHGELTYRGVTLSNNGNNFKGHYTLGEVYRAAFIAGVNGVDITFRARLGLASSANLLITHYDRDLKNVCVDGHFDEINGPLGFESNDATNPRFDNIKIKFHADTLGTNITGPMCRFRQYVSGVLQSSGDMIGTGWDLTITSGDQNPNVPIQLNTSTSGIEGVILETNQKNHNYYAGGLEDIAFISRDGQSITRGLSGDPDASTLSLPLDQIIPSPGYISGRLLVLIHATDTDEKALEEYDISSKLDSGGTIGALTATLQLSRYIGGSPSVTVSKSGGNLTISTTMTNATTAGFIQAKFTKY